jgi:hypothetical protein
MPSSAEEGWGKFVMEPSGSAFRNHHENAANLQLAMG